MRMTSNVLVPNRKTPVSRHPLFFGNPNITHNSKLAAVCGAIDSGQFCIDLHGAAMRVWPELSAAEGGGDMA